MKTGILFMFFIVALVLCPVLWVPLIALVIFAVPFMILRKLFS